MTYSLRTICLGTATALLLATVSLFAADLTAWHKETQERPGNRPSWMVKLYLANETQGIGPIDRPDVLPGGGLRFSFQKAEESWFSLYLLTDYQRDFNGADITGKTVTAEIAVRVAQDTVFRNRSRDCPNTSAYARLELQTVTGNTYEPDDYWASKGEPLPLAADLSAMDKNGRKTVTLTASTLNPRDWVNIDLQSGDTRPAEFAAALKKVKRVGLVFGSACRLASGVATTGGGGQFELRSYRIE